MNKKQDIIMQWRCLIINVRLKTLNIRFHFTICSSVTKANFVNPFIQPTKKLCIALDVILI